MTSDTCLRGFSFMPEKKIEVKLEYIENEELERAWKTSRRQRMKEQEQKIWDEFVQEQDVLSSVCEDDPYQFLEQLPESYLKELMDIELKKMKAEEENVKSHTLEQEQNGDGDSPRFADDVPQLTVTFAEEHEAEDSDVIHIINDERDDPSGPEDDPLSDSLASPGTVREKIEEEKEPSQLSLDKGPSSKSSENVTSIIESSIYCAKVKDLRGKINEEILAIINTLESRDTLSIEPEELAKAGRRCSEFCARFSRIYMYQLQRQIHDVKRNTHLSLPFARHTHFQSQVVRIVSLHQNLLQSLQVFHRSLSGGAGAGVTAALRALVASARAASEAAAAVPGPAQAQDLYNDTVLSSCDLLDKAIDEFSAKMSACVESSTKTSTHHTKKRKSNAGRSTKSRGPWTKTATPTKSVADSRLSMYSLDTLRGNAHHKSTSSKDIQPSAGASKPHAAAAAHKSPRASRRPLMRDPHAGKSRGHRLAPDAEIRTMVENVEPCASSHISRSTSASPRVGRSRRLRAPAASPRVRRPASPQKTSLRSISPKKNRRPSPKPKPVQVLEAVISSARSIAPPETADNSQPQLSPVSRISCAKKEAVKETVSKCEGDTPVSTPKLVEEVEKMEKAKRDVASASKLRCAKKETTPRGEGRAGDTPASTPRLEDTEKIEREKVKVPIGRCEVTRIVRQLCGGDAAGNRNERVSGAKNAQLLCVNGSIPRQPSTPQLLRILEETIQKKVPKPLFQKSPSSPVKNTEKFRLTFNIPDRTAENLFRYRTRFVQHMLASPMYANSSVGNPWEIIANISERMIDDLLLQCAEEMQLRDVVQNLYQAETC